MANGQTVMTNEALEREQCYRVAMALAKRLLADGIINSDDYQTIDKMMLSRFQPVLSGLYPELVGSIT